MLIYLFTNVNFNNLTGQYKIYETWGIQVGEYGAQANRSWFEIATNEALLNGNPSTIQIIEPGQTSEANQTVLLDIVYDHLLADNWTDISDIAMPDFTESVHTKLGLNYTLYPERMQQFYNNMVKYNFLPDYGTLEGVEQTLIRLQMRAKTDVDFVAAIATMENEKGRLRDLFLYFFDQMQAELASKGYARL
jgi:hypothetical protein